MDRHCMWRAGVAPPSDGLLVVAGGMLCLELVDGFTGGPRAGMWWVRHYKGVDGHCTWLVGAAVEVLLVAGGCAWTW